MTTSTIDLSAVTSQGNLCIDATATTVYASVPCPLKVRFKAAFEAFMCSYNQQHDKPIYCPTVLEGASHDAEEHLLNATCAEQLPEIILTMNIGNFFDADFKRRFIDTGILVGYKANATRLPAKLDAVDTLLKSALYAFGSWAIVQDLVADPVEITVKRWLDLADASLTSSINLHGCPDHFAGSSLLFVIHERGGDQAVQNLARNIKQIAHFSKLIKTINQRSSGQNAQFTMLPGSAAYQIPSSKKTAPVTMDEGPLFSPMLLLVKAGMEETYQPILDFFFSPEMRDVLASGDTQLLDAIDWTLPFTCPDWASLLQGDYPAECERLNQLFIDALPSDVALT